MTDGGGLREQARATIEAGGAEHEVFRLDSLQSRFDVFRLPYSLRVLLENVLRTGSDADVEAVATWVAADEPSREISFRPGPRPPAGLHRRAGDRRPRGDARRDARSGRRPGEGQPADPRRARDRPLGAGGRVRHPPRDHGERRARLRAQRRALRVPPLGPGRVREPQGRSAEHGHLPPGEPRVPRARRRDARRDGLPGHAARDRLAHDDGERARRARLGRRRDRGRGRAPRRGGLDARPAGGRLPPLRRAARGRDRDRPRPARDRDAPRARRGREVRRVLRPRARRPAGRRPRDDREHVAGVRRDLRVLPGRRGDADVPEADRPRRTSGSRSSRPTRKEQGLFHDPDDAPTYTQVVELDLGDVEPSLAGPRRPQDRVPLGGVKESFHGALETFGVPYPNGSHDKESADSFPASDPPVRHRPRLEAHHEAADAPAHRIAVAEAAGAHDRRRSPARTARRTSSATARW